MPVTQRDRHLSVSPRQGEETRALAKAVPVGTQIEARSEGSRIVNAQPPTELRRTRVSTQMINADFGGNDGIAFIVRYVRPFWGVVAIVLGNARRVLGSRQRNKVSILTLFAQSMNQLMQRLGPAGPSTSRVQHVELIE